MMFPTAEMMGNFGSSFVGGLLIPKLGSVIGVLMMAYAMLQSWCPYELRSQFMKRYTDKLINLFNPYIHITFAEHNGGDMKTSFTYDAIERYLNGHSTNQAKHLKGNVIHGTEAVVLTMANYQEVYDEFKGIKLWWSSPEEIKSAKDRYFSLTFHRKFRDVICREYLKHVMEQGKAITINARKRKLFTNKNGYDYDSDYRRRYWGEVPLDHPATFETLAMDPDKKQEIIDDLISFSEAKDYYKSVGKAWKRGYLLHGPPGTGKSTMVAAMANLLGYDVYDLELTAVKDNCALKKLLIATSPKSITVIEDIDCSLNLTGQREEEKEKDLETREKESKVTLSGLLNMIDGLWSACGGERIIVFTTNYVEKLDPALIRRGRMDKHIELSYCGFEGFKVLAKNYLNIDHDDSFDTIRRLLEEVNMSPADVAENLMPNKLRGEKKERCLERLVKALEEAKEEARRKAVEEEKLNAQKLAQKEEDEKKKKQKKKKKKN